MQTVSEDTLKAAEVVLIGCSLGGLHALDTLFRGISGSFPLPVLIVQHRSPASGSALRSCLQRHCPLPIIEPEDKQEITGGHVYLAPAEYHLLLERGFVELSTEGPVSHARPSVDVLFESAAESYGAGVVAIVLTGSGCDGARGAAAVKAAGGRLLVQDPDTAECPAMPLAAVRSAPADAVLPLSELRDLLSQHSPPATE